MSLSSFLDQIVHLDYGPSYFDSSKFGSLLRFMGVARHSRLIIGDGTKMGKNQSELLIFVKPSTILTSYWKSCDFRMKIEKKTEPEKIIFYLQIKGF